MLKFKLKITLTQAQQTQKKRTPLSYPTLSYENNLSLSTQPSRHRSNDLGSGVNLPVFETSASTDSAIWASAKTALSNSSAVQR